MSLLTQVIVKFVGKAFSFPNKSLDKNTKKPTDEAAVSQKTEKLLVPKEHEESASLTRWDGLVNLAMMMGAVIILKLFLGLFVHSSDVSDVVIPVVNLLPKIGHLPLSLLLYPVFAMLLTYRIEFLLLTHQIRWEYALCSYIAVLATGLVLPVISLRRHEDLDLLIQNLVVCLFFIILTLKLVSFIQVNKSHRDALEANENIEIPVNLSIRDLASFWFSPNLVYRPQESSNKQVRVLYVLKKVVEVFLLQALSRQGMLFMPNILDELLGAADNEDMILFLER